MMEKILQLTYKKLEANSMEMNFGSMTARKDD